MLNQTAEYGMRAVVHLAALGPGERMRAGQLARETGIPANYLSKILHQLAASGILESHLGRNGGFNLARTAESISMASVVAPLDSLGRFGTCVLGRPVCSDRSACTAHSRWKPLASALVHFLETTSVADVMPGRARRRSESSGAPVR